MDEVDVLVALAGLAQLERTRQILLDGAREALDLLFAELAREREGRELRAVEDLVRMRAADPGERPLIAKERVQPAVVAGEDLTELVRAEPERLRPDVRQLGLGLLRRLEPDPGALLRAALGQDRARLRPRSAAGTPASSGPFSPLPDAGSGRRSSGGSAAAARRPPSGTGATCRGAAHPRTGVRRAPAAAGRTSSASRCERTGLQDRRARHERVELAHPGLDLG